MSKWAIEYYAPREKKWVLHTTAPTAAIAEALFDHHSAEDRKHKWRTRLLREKNPALTDKELFRKIRAMKLSISKRDGEYRIAPKTHMGITLDNKQQENMAYYTNDKNDALQTAYSIAGRAVAHEYKKRYINPRPKKRQPRRKLHRNPPPQIESAKRGDQWLISGVEEHKKRPNVTKYYWTGRVFSTIREHAEKFANEIAARKRAKELLPNIPERMSWLRIEKC